MNGDIGRVVAGMHLWERKSTSIDCSMEVTAVKDTDVNSMNHIKNSSFKSICNP
jgi:hypothetical protein